MVTCLQYESCTWLGSSVGPTVCPGLWWNVLSHVVSCLQYESCTWLGSVVVVLCPGLWWNVLSHVVSCLLYEFCTWLGSSGGPMSRSMADPCFSGCRLPLLFSSCTWWTWSQGPFVKEGLLGSFPILWQFTSFYWNNKLLLKMLFFPVPNLNIIHLIPWKFLATFEHYYGE